MSSDAMHREYALEPAALASWEQVRFFLSHMGPWAGRFIARYPKKWKKMVYDSLRCPDVERSRIEERLRGLDERVFTDRAGARYDGALPWLENALREHARDPFHAIIAAGATSDAIDAAEISDVHPAWRHERDRLVARTSAAYGQSLGPLLARSRRVVVIDPYFRADQTAKREPLIEFCMALAAGAVVEVHTSTLHVADHFSRSVAQQHLPARLPAGLTLTLHVWQQRAGGERLHNRYVLTDRGGVRFGDSIETGGQGEHDLLSLLEEASRAALWSQYVDPAAAFDRVGTVLTIVGTRTMQSR